MADLAPTSVLNDSISNPSSSDTRQIFGSNLKSGKVQPTQLRLLTTSERCLQYKITTTCNLRIGPKSNCPGLTVKASRESLGITEQHKNNKLERVAETDDRSELFEDMKQRFVDFKKHKYMENLEHYQNLAKCQAPKFMVISCADSRVCPSTILGFQPGEAFVVRNIANLVPPFESGPSETNAALEFSVNFLKIENILVVGHSCCGGIRALMGMDDEVDKSSFIQNWVVVGKDARSWTKAAASKLSFDQQCKHCEKESINRSLLNLLTYPWIEEKVKKGVLAVHGGYYDFVECTFEKWTLDYKEDNLKEKHGRISVKNHLFWS
ncbi:beta carbonic anhydrase 5, chloroplastic isoform X1 [Malus domestica]|uniref:beta carbonic anhydrase 5, chloroplastic isoform X1 n=1 Tax=Malus domestica TaxID=3750 RepID=UPI003975EECC